MKQPLQLPADRWKSEWLVLPSWRVLHLVAEIEWDDAEDMIFGHGTTVCGETGQLRMPGVLSRIGLPRCVHCCRAVGIEPGLGNPGNEVSP